MVIGRTSSSSRRAQSTDGRQGASEGRTRHRVTDSKKVGVSTYPNDRLGQCTWDEEPRLNRRRVPIESVDTTLLLLLDHSGVSVYSVRVETSSHLLGFNYPVFLEGTNVSRRSL